VIIDVTDRKRAERAGRETEELLATVLERQRIAEDLHDGIIQSIYATGLAIKECRRLIDDGRPDDARDRLQDTITMLDVIMRDIRNYVAGLHPEALRDLGLSRALLELGRDLELNQLASVIVNAAPDLDGALPPQVARELFHIGREALANVAKHAPGAHAVLNLTRANGTVTLSVHDDGPGFDAARAASGRGLRNIAERARRAGGSMAVETAAGQGTRITVRVLLPASA